MRLHDVLDVPPGKEAKVALKILRSGQRIERFGALRLGGGYCIVEDRSDQVILVREVAIDRLFRHRRQGGDLVGAGTGIALGQIREFLVAVRMARRTSAGGGRGLLVRVVVKVVLI